MEDARVSILRQRLIPLINGVDQQIVRHSYSADHYDAELVEMVKNFQARHRLKVDGVVGPETRDALNLSQSFREEQLQINLERMRWLEREFSPTLLLVDIAGAQASFTRDGQIVWLGRVQVGTARRPTPTLRSSVSYLTFQPHLDSATHHLSSGQAAGDPAGYNLPCQKSAKGTGSGWTRAEPCQY